MLQHRLAEKEFTHFHLFCGLGAAAKGFNRGKARVGNSVARMRCLGGIDVDAAAIRDFERLTGVRGTVMDLFDREQYEAFHGRKPPADWREATPADIRRAAGGESPAALVLSAPCKGFSGLLSQTKSVTAKYQALNRLTLRGIWLAMEAWVDNPPKVICFENVPRIQNRGRALLDQITAMLRAYGYATAETTHDCGELGGLAQSRKRFLLVARHIATVPNLLYQPDKRPLRAVGDVLGLMPMPGEACAGPMHRVPSLQFRTWIRLAFVQAGSDWRSLNRLNVEDGYLRDYLLVPCSQEGSGSYGVRRWEDAADAIRGRSGPSNGPFSVADPRFIQSARWSDGQAYGVNAWTGTSGTIGGQQNPGQGRYAVADPRMGQLSATHKNVFRVVRWDKDAGTVTSGHGPSSGGQAVADPRAHTGFGGKGKYRITAFDEAAGTVIARSDTGQGAYAVADPRTGLVADRGAYLTGGHFGVVPWTSSAGAVSSAACHDNGRWTVADPRMPAANENVIAIIQAEDGTWHRPFTTLELAALQSLVTPEEAWGWNDANKLAYIQKYGSLAAEGGYWKLDGESDQAHRERIGNAIPPEAAEAIGNEIARTLLLASNGETFSLSAAPVWVRPMVTALMVANTGTTA